MSEFRKDPVLERWVIISTERSPIYKHSDNGNEKASKCQFCEGNEDFTTSEILSYRDQKTKSNSKGWWVRVIPDKYPILKVEEPFVKKGEGLYDKITGIGAHEIIIETPLHINDIFMLDNNHIKDIISVYIDRILDLKKDPRFEYIMIFKNKGKNAGSNLNHAHSHLIALPIIPKRINEELEGSLKYFNYKARCVFCDIIDEEVRVNKRIVFENDHFIALCPFAARSPFEVWILPKLHESNFCNIQRSHILSFAEILKLMLEKISKATGGADYNYILHNSPLKVTSVPHYHWHLEILPRIKNTAGFERGTGFYVNPISPEISAEYLININ